MIAKSSLVAPHSLRTKQMSHIQEILHAIPANHQLYSLIEKILRNRGVFFGVENSVAGILSHYLRTRTYASFQRRNVSYVNVLRIPGILIGFISSNITWYKIMAIFPNFKSGWRVDSD